MSKKDYISAARTFHQIMPKMDTFLVVGSKQDAARFASIGTWTACVEAVADLFASDNPRFDRTFFLAACKGGPVRIPRAKKSA